jgi:hypothetical protein
VGQVQSGERCSASDTNALKARQALFRTVVRLTGMVDQSADVLTRQRGVHEPSGQRSREHRTRQHAMFTQQEVGKAHVCCVVLCEQGPGVARVAPRKRSLGRWNSDSLLADEDWTKSDHTTFGAAAGSLSRPTRTAAMLRNAALRQLRRVSSDAVCQVREPERW